MIPIPYFQLVLAGAYGALAAAMVITALLVLPAMFCFARGRTMLRDAIT